MGSLAFPYKNVLPNMFQLACKVPPTSAQHSMDPISKKQDCNANIPNISLSSAVMSRPVSGAAVDRSEGDRVRNTAVINLLATTRDRKTEESMSVGSPTVDYGQEEDDYEVEDEYYDEEYEDGLSGDYEMPRSKT